jgi:pimeloyl-ACP methyl ester carboxylesterase
MKYLIFVFIIIFLSCCQKEKITFAGNVSETFYVENAGASMRVLVEGNSASRTFILVIHGGPGVSSYIYNTDYITKHIENSCAIAYWDQRDAGASQGNSNSKHLNLNQMTEDLQKVISVMKYRYGSDIKLILLAHSFGGLIASDFITRDLCQSMIKGLIYVDGSHNYGLNDTLTRKMLLQKGQYEISQKRNTEEWQEIVEYCNAHKGNFTFEESMQLESYGSKAESYIDSVNKINAPYLILKNSISGKYPLTSIITNLLKSDETSFNKELSVTSFSGSLNKVYVPVLILWGKYDFICPSELGMDFYNRIGSPEKKFVISPVSGHNIYLQDEKLFCDEINSFLKRL